MMASTAEPELAPTDAPSNAASRVAPSSLEPRVSTAEPPSTTEETTHSATVVAKATSIFTLGGVAAATGCSLLSSTGGAPATARFSDTAAEMATPSAESVSRFRAPSATLAVVLVGQIQFLATLSLVDTTGAEDPTGAENSWTLEWANLWTPASLVRRVTTLQTTRRLQETESSGRCELAEAGSDDIGAIVFIGNLALFAVILLTIFLFHVLLASGVEAYWLTKERANEEVEMAQLQGTPVRELMSARLSPSSGEPGGHSDVAGATICPGSRQPRQWPPRSGSQLCKKSWYRRNSSDDEEEGVHSVTHSESRWSLSSETRDRSTSAWLHFPHVELVFLLFAFEGAIAAGVSALRESRCPWVLVAAATALLLYPILMFAMVCRTIVLRVRPNDLIAFEPTSSHSNPTDNLVGKVSFLSRVLANWKESHSLISWADTGQWVTVEKTYTESRPEDDWIQTIVDEDSRREGDRFRIGFEPLFVDFTKTGSWFMVYSLVQSAVFASIGVLIDKSVQQLSLFCGQFFVTCIVLVLFKPFANRFINTIAVCLSGADAVCMAVLTIAALAWEGSENARRADRAVVIIQLMVLVALILPMYVDVSAFIIHAISTYMKKEETIPGTEENNAQLHENSPAARSTGNGLGLVTWPMEATTMMAD
eukprot:jgi/Undpi1/9684/HiC_scaffold_27.g12140.m1